MTLAALFHIEGTLCLDRPHSLEMFWLWNPVRQSRVSASILSLDGVPQGVTGDRQLLSAIANLYIVILAGLVNLYMFV
jgi:hypothetical protein